MSYSNNENDKKDIEKNIKITEVRHRTVSEHSAEDSYSIFANNKQVILCIVVVAVIAVMAFVGIGRARKISEKNSPSEQEANSTTNADETSFETDADTQNESEEETELQLTLNPEAEDSEIVQLVSAFYRAYIISGDINEVSSYIDSANAIDAGKLSINKKYIENVSDFQCYKSDLDIVDDNYTIVIVTYKVKLYNYDELLPSIDILFLVDGDGGYRVHNLTVDDQFDKQKIENDQNFQILAKNVSSELSGLLEANTELNEVYNLYLHPEISGQEE